MRPEFCAGVNCSAWLRDERSLPLCRRCWSHLEGLPRERIRELAEAGHALSARALAALVTELPVRDICSQYLEHNRTWQTVRGNVADVLARKSISYREAVSPWHEFLEALFWSLGGTKSLGNWTHVELACALVRTRTGVDGYDPYLIAAAVDLDARLAAENPRPDYTVEGAHG